MAKANQEKSNNGEKQPIETLKQRYQDLDRKKITAEANLKAAEERLGELKADAKQKYGTDDLAELERKLAEMKAENESKRAKYQADLDRIEQDLNAVEREFKSLDAPGEKE
ncbi:MAG TPA: hypothetical protein VKX17_07615 [Planctomycetota bacterium]|nr:hypothetical protein [Planctomycetota bacterium]